MTVQSTKLAEFQLLRERLVAALQHISNISYYAAVGLIVLRDAENAKGGISFNNVVKADQYELFASYPIFKEEMNQYNTHFHIENADDWPVYFICCSEQFIKSILTLPPIMYPDSMDEYVDMVFYSVKDGETVKSETVIFGEHRASTCAIMKHSGLKVVGGKIVEARDGNIEEDALKAYV